MTDPLSKLFDNKFEEKLKKQITHQQAYEEAEEEFKKEYNHRKYSSFESYRITRSNRIKNRNKGK